MLLEVRNLHVGYGDAPAVWDVSLDVDAGEIVSVIGPNGAGKTTLINAIAGMLRYREGDLRFDGADMKRVRAHGYCGHGIALVPEGRRLFTKMTVEENLELGCYLPGPRAARAQSLERVYGLFPILRQKRAQLAGELSGGQQQMVAIGRALMAQPRIVLFDEPSLGLAPTIVDDMFRHHRPGSRRWRRRAAGRAERAEGAQCCRPRLRPGAGDASWRQACRTS